MSEQVKNYMFGVMPTPKHCILYTVELVTEWD